MRARRGVLPAIAETRRESLERRLKTVNGAEHPLGKELLHPHPRRR